MPETGTSDTISVTYRRDLLMQLQISMDFEIMKKKTISRKCQKYVFGLRCLQLQSDGVHVDQIFDPMGHCSGQKPSSLTLHKLQ